MLTIKLPLTREQFEANLNFIHQCTRKALLPAESHEAITGVLNDLLAGIQPENRSDPQGSDPQTATPKTPTPEERIKAASRQKAKKQ